MNYSYLLTLLYVFSKVISAKKHTIKIRNSFELIGVLGCLQGFIYKTNY